MARFKKTLAKKKKKERKLRGPGTKERQSLCFYVLWWKTEGKEGDWDRADLWRSYPPERGKEGGKKVERRRLQAKALRWGIVSRGKDRGCVVGKFLTPGPREEGRKRGDAWLASQEPKDCGTIRTAERRLLID